MNEFKVGDAVRIISECGTENKNAPIGSIHTIKKIEYCYTQNIFLGDLNRNGNISSCGKYSWVYHPENLELVSKWGSCLTGCGSEEDTLELITDYKCEFKNNKKTIMSKITTFAKNLVLSGDEKLLRKYGLKNECGEFTNEANELVISKLVKENEAYLVELAKKMEEEESKK